MKKTSRSVLGLAGVITASALAGVVAAAATPESATRMETRATLKHEDGNFLEKAVKSSLEEVQISKVAVARTSNPKVRDFAQTLIDDHENANAVLTALAANRGVTLPAKDSDANAWSKKDGKNFDKDYIDKMVSSHEDAVKLFQKEANNGDDAEAVAFARKTLPKLQHHLEQANDLKRLMNN